MHGPYQHTTLPTFFIDSVSMAMPADSRCELKFEIVFEIAGAKL